MKLRKQRATREVSLDEDFQTDGDILPTEVADWAPNPEQLYRATELRNILVKTLKELSPILRTVFVLRDIERLSIDQTAEVLNITHGAVKARLWRVRLQIRERLNKYFSKQTDSARAELLTARHAAGAWDQGMDSLRDLLDEQKDDRDDWPPKHANRSDRSRRKHNGISV